uniref:Single domain-containing protein n=1 Tax=Strigamia maritima TaxID=126957 RepID=T1J632_STRMM
MKLILFVAAFCIFQCYSVSGNSSSLYVDNKDGKCVGPDGELHARGQDWYDNDKCETYQCLERSDGQFIIYARGCVEESGRVLSDEQIERGCHLGARSGPWPECCPDNLCLSSSGFTIIAIAPTTTNEIEEKTSMSSLLVAFSTLGYTTVGFSFSVAVKLMEPLVPSDQRM